MNGVAVYIHIPFCTVKCGYCDFNAYAGLGRLTEAYGRALLAEIDAWAPLLDGAMVTSISFGGGTPGEFPAPAIAAVIDAIRSRRRVAGGTEVSIEANPGTVTGEYLGALRAAGVTRLSLGAQSFDAAELRFLDRIHSPEATSAAIRLARNAGFESVSLDLIYGLPGQPFASWHATVDAALALTPDHLSCYALTVEEGTPLARRVAAGEVASPDADAAAEMYEWAEDRLKRAAFGHYELSNWAQPGHESRHNLAYWTDHPYLGIGAGAHGYVALPGTAERLRYENIAHPAAYIASLQPGGPGATTLPSPAVSSAAYPSLAIAMFDWIETRLRLVDGFEAPAFKDRFGRLLDDVVGRPLDDCQSGGLLERTDDRLRLTPRGRLLHSEVCARLLAHMTD